MDSDTASREREFRIKTKSFILIFLLFLPALSPAAAETFEARVIRVFDGDTLLVRVQGRKEYVRLREIDAPEVSRRKQAGQEPWAKRARDFAAAGVRNGVVRLEVEDGDRRDAYHRLLAYVFAGNSLVNDEMVRSGNAFFYPAHFRGRYASRLQKSEGEARRKGLGVWDRRNGLSERPREFRDRNRRDETLFSSAGRGRIQLKDNRRARGEDVN